jgi:TnpA family transposase
MIVLPQSFSDEEMVRNWTLSENDKIEINKFRKIFRPFIAIQLCTIRLYGRFLKNIHDLSPQITNYLNFQLGLPPLLTIIVPEREATYLEQRKKILSYTGFCKFSEDKEEQLINWIEYHANKGELPNELFPKVERYLLSNRILLPGPSVITRIITQTCSKVHDKFYESIYIQLTPELCKSIDGLLNVAEGEQNSYFYQLKEYPPSAKISSIKSYLRRYNILLETGINSFNLQAIDTPFMDYLFKLAKRYKASNIKQLKEYKRYALMICFLLQVRSILLDHLVKMHDQYIGGICRETKNEHEKKHRQFRRRQKISIDTIINTTNTFFDLPDDQPFYKKDIWNQVNEKKLRESIENLRIFQHLEEKGYGNLLVNRYPSLRKYFADFIHLPFEAEKGSSTLSQAISIIRKLDSGELSSLPQNVPIEFVPKELRSVLKDETGKIKRNTWEMSLALTIKDALRSGDIYLPQSKQHVSFWNLMLSDSRWKEERGVSFKELNQPQQHEIKSVLLHKFYTSTNLAEKNFQKDNFAEIRNGKLKLKRDDKIVLPSTITKLQKAIDVSMPSIRIEQLLMEVDRMTGFSRHFTSISNQESKPNNFYKTLIAAIISQATNLGVVAMGASVPNITVDMLRHVLQYYIREETLKSANAEIVNQHHKLPLSAVHGTGTISSSDDQRFKIRADSLLASYYPRYYGYYEKAIGIYTHVSDQYSVFSTKAISCAPREAMYVLDGILENNTILKIREHTTDTAGYTEIVFTLCYLLGYYFMPRIRDLKDQQLYRIDKNVNYGIFTPLLNKTADPDIIEEQWEPMIRVAFSLKKRTTPAHIVVRRLTSSYPSDRLSRAFTNLGRIVKTEYILRYLTDLRLRKAVQLQLNKGEYRHKLPRWIFFANQGEFNVRDYEEIMNKASCLSFVSNAILYWNTIQINKIVDGLREQGEEIDDKTLSHISLLPFKHVLPNGTYFIDDIQI